MFFFFFSVITIKINWKEINSPLKRKLAQKFQLYILDFGKKLPARASWGLVRPPCGSSQWRYCSGPLGKNVYKLIIMLMLKWCHYRTKQGGQANFRSRMGVSYRGRMGMGSQVPRLWRLGNLTRVWGHLYLLQQVLLYLGWVWGHLHVLHVHAGALADI